MVIRLTVSRIDLSQRSYGLRHNKRDYNSLETNLGLYVLNALLGRGLRSSIVSSVKPVYCIFILFYLRQGVYVFTLFVFCLFVCWIIFNRFSQYSVKKWYRGHGMTYYILVVMWIMLS